MNRILFGVVLASCFAASAVNVGDVLRFAGDGGLREVTVIRQLSPTTSLGSLDGYGGVLNSTIVDAREGWTMDIDDWHTRRVWHVVKTDGGTDVQVRSKPKSGRRRCRTLKRSVGRSETNVLAKQRKVASGGLTDGWEIDPVKNEVDVLVVLDRSAVEWLHSQNRTCADFAASQVGKMNAALANSGLANDFKVTLCGTYEADFDVTRDCGADEDEVLSVAIEEAVDSSRSVWKSIRAERDRVGADIVVILANTQPEKDLGNIVGTVGISYGLENEPESGKYGLDKGKLDAYREAAFCACDVRQVEDDHTFAHEVGHVFGAGHSELLSPDYSVPGPQLFRYSNALMYKDAVDDEYYYTIMGYDSVDGRWDSPDYVEIPLYSSPVLRNPITGSIIGDFLHDNVQTLRETYAIVSQYRANPLHSKEFVVPEIWKKARTIRGKAFRTSSSPETVMGVFTLKCGKANKKGRAKVSATLTGRDGKKISYKARAVDVLGKDDVVVSWGDGPDAMSVTISGNMFSGSDGLVGGISVASAAVGGETSRSAKFYVRDAPDEIDGMPIWKWPDGEPVEMQGRKWSCGKAAKVKWENYRCKGDDCPACSPSWSVAGAPAGACGYSEGVNVCGLKLTYKWKDGTFSGSFKLYATKFGKSPKGVKLNAKVTGVVIDGVGYGQVMVKKNGPWIVTVQ